MTAQKTKTEEKKTARLVILDSHAILHRAYHAIPDFSSSKGEPTGALYGLISMLLKIVHDLKPDYIVAARDLPGKTHRHDAFEAYKATRVKAEDELVAQLIRAPIVFKAFGIPLYEHAGFEADDVIGTIVQKLSKQKNIETVIASGDMDALQLVSPSVRVFTLRKGLNDTVMYDEERVMERYGFGPEHVVDYKALRGDPSDNIPGIRGIGEKTATDLIKEFGSIEEMYAALKKKPEGFAKKVKPRVFQLVKDGEESAIFSKKLGTIHCDVPIKFELPETEWNLTEHTESIFALCDELGFRALKERVKGVVGKSATPEASTTEVKPREIGENVDPKKLKETSVALWLLHSDTTNPTQDDILSYAHTEDFRAAREMIFKQLKETEKLQGVFDQIEKPLIPVTEKMTEIGILLDTAYIKKLSREYTKGLGEIAGRIYQHAGHEFNVNSPKQLGAVLFDELKIVNVNGRQKKTAGGARTTCEDELAKLSSLHPIIADVLAYRELQKLLSTYIEKMPALVDSENRLHAEFVQTGTTTGRMSSQNPNLQNIPIKSEYGRRIRSGFVASPGFVLVAIDYSQIELRIAAGLSGDEKLSRVFQAGGDVHTAVASDVFEVPPENVDREMRRRAKVINFGILYGMGVNALRANMGENVSREEAARYLSAYFETYAGLARYIEHTKADATRNGYTETLFGRRRYFPGLTSVLPNLRAQAERRAVNAPIQGTSADIIKLAMVEVDALIEKNGWREKARLLLQVHDELVYEIKREDLQEIMPVIKHTMESVVDPKKLSGVPIVAEANTGPNWGDLRKLS
ncbi:MAG: polymerase protein [Candidatus Kaiserbacteria bacterium GW2011_GWB1_52_6]|uniref:DNA-directed DNA polymerase n=2 Tax=Candidatus Kaiseribacteriota TaxID=1752734 RepID=A0A0G1X6I0_9BACT|nr:MAG: polymerase protein [Candidatus Kaiserbacteria bacterium GW2011_GWA2_52_12]KKW26440.1 MAG: polymerase protein [Candidatus Kaiserbacteria bacterium GW2011_GWB1_52_6]